MTVAIKRQNGDMIWFDAILQFGRQYAASVTKHPIESGASISDHTIVENPVLYLSGVISDADFNLSRPIISQSDADNYGITNKQFVNNEPVQIVPEIKDNLGFGRFLPETVGQFISPAKAPTVNVPASAKVVTASLLEGVLGDMWAQREEFELVNFKGSTIDEIYYNCVITGLDITETPEGGDALYPNLTIEQVTYVVSANTKIPQNVQASVKAKASPDQNKGRKQGPSGSDVEKEGDSPEGPTNVTKDQSVWKERLTRNG